MNAKELNRRDFLKIMGMGSLSLLVPSWARGMHSPAKKPNIILIFCDDQGYADVGAYGRADLETPHLDKMAAEGVKFTDFYSAAPSCTPSRAALMTGCYPQRVGLPTVIGPNSNIGLHDDETTIAEILREQRYATACYGKWHLGHHEQFLPLQHGFDEYFGIPYSHDMWPYHPTHPENYPDLPLVEDNETIEVNPDLSQLTTWYTERAVGFIEEHKDEPFFIYIPHSMPHVPLYASTKFLGKSDAGLYGDVIMEIDWSVGQIMYALKKHNIDENTLIIYTSDNGPWLSYGDHAGSAKPLREGKGTTFDGGQREPCLMRWPGQIPAGHVCREMATAMDILPTVSNLAGGRLPKRKIDGKDIWPLISGQADVGNLRETFFFYRGWRLEAVRSDKWKLHLPYEYRHVDSAGTNGNPGPYEQLKIDLSLFNLETDIGEEFDVSEQYPGVVEELLKLVEEMRANLGDSSQNRTGDNRRPPGRI